MALEDAPVWKEPLVVADVPVEVMKSVDLPVELSAAAPLEQQVAQSVAPPTTPPESSTQPLSTQPPSLWAWLKQQLLGATKK